MSKHNLKEAIYRAEKYLDSDPSMSAYILKDLPEVEEVGHKELMWLLVKGDTGCHKNDLRDTMKQLKAKAEENQNEKED